MKPIPTFYNDTKYRSRLEARWAMFFNSIGIFADYEPCDIGKGYIPDFYLTGMIFNKLTISEIKPLPPNEKYVEYLESVRIPGGSDFYIFVGNPSFYQPDGIVIYGANGNYIDRGFELQVCPHCKYYTRRYCSCSYFPPNPNWQDASQKAIDFRFDL